jgi:hypothetical protein
MKRLLLIPIVFILGCNLIQSRKPIPEGRLKETYLALLEYTERSPAAMPDSIRRAHTDSIFTAHGITETEFRAAMQEYANNPEKWREFTKEMIAQKEEKPKAKVENPATPVK